MSTVKMEPTKAAVGLTKCRVKTPTIFQMEAAECGAAALAIVLAHFGRWVSLEELREACGVTRDGSNARSLLKAARSYGLEVHAYRDSMDSIKKRSVPLIVFWEMNHFLVVEGWKDSTWYLNDPASGPRTVTDEEFSKGFSGIVMTFAPTPEFVKQGSKPNPWLILFRYIGSSKPALVFLIISGIALIIPGLALPALSRAFVDDFLVSQAGSFGVAIILGMVFCVVVQFLLIWMQQLVATRTLNMLTTRLFVAHTQRILRLCMRFFEQRSPTDIWNRIRMGNRIAALISGPLVQALQGSLIAIVYLAVIFVISPILGIIVLLSAGLVTGIMAKTSRVQQDIGQRFERDYIDSLVAQSSVLDLMEAIKADGGEIESFQKLSNTRTKQLTSQQQQDVLLTPILAIPTLVISLTTLLMFSVGALQVMNNTISFGSLLAVQILAGSVLVPLGSMMGLSSQIQQLQAVISRLSDIEKTVIDPAISAQLDRDSLSARREPSVIPGASTEGTEASLTLSGKLELRNITFGYSKMDLPLIEAFDLELDPGARVALVGGSGSGKSTLGRLIVGLADPWQGEILFDGVERLATDRRIIADGVAFVDQKITLFEGSIRQNITMWDETIPDSEVQQAVRDAQLLDVLTERPGGLEAEISSGGAELSGGQRQRLEIARALVRNPKIIVLDEATSALDTLTEQEVMLALRRRGCSCVIVAHRLSTIRDADELIVLSGGKVVERGKHDQLIANRGPYFELVGE